MRILICTNRDLAGTIALNLLVPGLAGHALRVVLTERVGAVADAEPPERRELRTAEQTLPNTVFFPAVESARWPDAGGRFLTLNEFAGRRGLPVDVVQAPNSGAGLDLIAGFAPDLILSIRYGAILKAPVIALPRLGVLNLHSGVLPDYRGVLATFRALMNDDAEIGCTLHYISDGTIDTGDVVGIARQPVRRDRSLLAHVLALYPPGIAMMLDAVRTLADGGELARLGQPRDAGNYYSYPTDEDWRAFTRRGWRVADPSDLAEALGRFVPQPG
jgi:methionyl-tRNA formyltransferase